jgi:hypothetical protein
MLRERPELAKFDNARASTNIFFKDCLIFLWHINCSPPIAVM